MLRRNDVVKRSVALDSETDRLLAALAEERHEGNRSLTVRELIRLACKQAGQSQPAKKVRA